MTINLSESVYDAWLASACMPPDDIRLLLEQYHDSASCYDAFQKRDEYIRKTVSPRLFSQLEKNGSESNLIRMRNMMEKHSIRVIRYDDSGFPELLNCIDQPPAILFYQGNPECLHYHRMLSMVGSRAASYSGQKAAGKLSRELSGQGVRIVSGLACGIDTAAHQGCIEGGSPTVAVIACGLETVYPKENIRLRNDILSHNGVILSEYAPGEKPSGWHFPFRNRIIAGLSQALVLIEARIRSGSMTTVQHALNQGKEVFVYPGDPESEQYEGNHQLLREGGHYFTCAEDILRDMNWLDNPIPVRHNSDCSAETVPVSSEQAAVIRALKPGKLSFEQLVEQTGLKPPALMSTLTILQISGQIEPLPGKLYQLKH